MSQMRKDAITGRWVIVAEPDGVQLADFRFKKFVVDTKFCPFCEGNEASTPPEILAIRASSSRANGPGWSVRVVPNSQPRLRVEGILDRRPEGIHDLMNGIGADEIIIETPRHDRTFHQLEVHEIANVIRAYATRIVDLEGDKRIRYVLMFKNHGEQAGAHTTSHTISRLMALAVTPRAVKAKLTAASEYYALKERCVYCDVLQQELRDARRLIAENRDFVAFAPFASRFPFEVCVMPKSHQSALRQISPGEIDNLALLLRGVLQKLDSTLGSPPYNLSLCNRPFMRPAEGYWKTIEEDFHWHVEVLPQVFRVTGFEWGSGVFYNPLSPETAARFLSF